MSKGGFQPTGQKSKPGRTLLRTAIGLVATGLALIQAPAIAAADRAESAWSLSGNGEGASKLTAIERDGQKLQVLYANGGNTLSVQVPAGGAQGAQPGDRLTLRCDCLLAEYDEATRRIERLLCGGDVQVTLAAAKTADGQPGRSSSFSAAALEFVAQRGPTPANAVGRSPLGLLYGSWTLHAARPEWSNLPEEFAGWLKRLPARQKERVLLTSDRLRVLADVVSFNPVQGVCTANGRVSGSFDGAPEAAAGDSPATKPDAGGSAGRSVAWSPLRRTVFSCDRFVGHFAIDDAGLRPAGESVLEDRVHIYQMPLGALTGEASLHGDKATLRWPLQPAAATPGGWQGYESLTVESGTVDRPDAELEMRDGDLTIRGGRLEYHPAEDEGTLVPAVAHKFAVSEMNLLHGGLGELPGSGTGGSKSAPSRVRLSASKLKFHLKERNFEAIGERLLENLPPAAAPAAPTTPSTPAAPAVLPPPAPAPGPAPQP